MTPSTTSLVLNLQYPNIATVAYAVQGDEGAREISAQLVDGSVAWAPPAGALATVRYRKPDGTTGFYDTMEDGSTPAVDVSGSGATIRIARQALTVPGGVVMQLNFYDESAQRVTTFSWIMIVQPSVLTDTQFASSDYYNILSQQIAAVLDAAAALTGLTASVTGLPAGSDPMVNVTGGTGGTPYNLAFSLPAGPVYIPAVDAAGDISWSNNGDLENPATQNIKGPRGVSITETVKKSGTGAPGTTDVYGVELSDGTEAGTFNVYNGSDGQGSPGSQAPLPDSASGAVGTAAAYSHEDHQHPYPGTTLEADVVAISANGTTSNTLIGLTEDFVICNWGLFSDAACTTPIAENSPICDITINTAANSWSVTIANFSAPFYLRPTFILKQN